MESKGTVSFVGFDVPAPFRDAFVAASDCFLTQGSTIQFIGTLVLT